MSRQSFVFEREIHQFVVRFWSVNTAAKLLDEFPLILDLPYKSYKSEPIEQLDYFWLDLYRSGFFQSLIENGQKFLWQYCHFLSK